MAKRPEAAPARPKDVRDLLLDAAWRRALHSSKNGKRVTQAQILLDAGCTPKQLRKEFGDCEGLMKETMTRAMAKWSEDMEVQVNPEASAQERLRERGKALVSWGSAHADVYRMLFLNLPELQMAPRRFEEAVAYERERADVAAVAGLQLDDPALDDIIFTHWVTLHGLTAMAISRPELGRRRVRQIARGILDQFIAQLESVAAQPARTRPEV